MDHSPSPVDEEPPSTYSAAEALLVEFFHTPFGAMVHAALMAGEEVILLDDGTWEFRPPRAR